MQLSYFIVDRRGRLQRIARDLVEGLWEGRRLAPDLGILVGTELRLITVLADENLMPAVCWFLRVELSAGAITSQSKIAAFEAMTLRHQRQFDHPSAQRQFEGWPRNWRRQLAVALDVAPTELKKLSIGGPLLMSELWGVPLEKVLQYFEEAAGE